MPSHKPREKEPHTWISHAFWGLCPDPHACMASTLLRKLSPYFVFSFLKYFSYLVKRVLLLFLIIFVSSKQAKGQWFLVLTLPFYPTMLSGPVLCHVLVHGHAQACIEVETLPAPWANGAIISLASTLLFYPAPSHLHSNLSPESGHHPRGHK